jgi:hypothetical protein
MNPPRHGIVIDGLRFLREDGDPQQVQGTFTVTLDDDAPPLTNTRMHVDFLNLPRTRSIVNMNGLVVPRPGVLHFRFVLDNGVATEYTVDIEHPPVVAAQAQIAMPGGGAARA